MASIKIVLKSNQPKKDKTIPILIRVTIDRRVKYFSTGYSVKEHQFREGSDNWVTKHPDSVLINRAIETKRAAIAETVYKADIESAYIDIDTLSTKKRKGSTFFSAIKMRMETLESRNQAAMYERLQSKLKVIQKAWGRDVAVCDLSKQWVDKYISHRLKDGIKLSTIKKDLSDFSGVLNAIENFVGVDYFKKAHKEIKPDPVNRDKLTLEDIKLLENTTLYGLNDVARDIFLFAFYTHGMRFQNVAMFDVKTIKGGYIRYQMNKGKKIREIEVHGKLAAIIEKYLGNKPYLFPVVKKEVKSVWDKKQIIGTANAMINTNLKRVAVICGIDKNLSTHISRHTFAYLSLKRGVSYPILKDALGHSNYKETEKYLKSLSDSDINEAVKGLYD